MHIFLEWPFGYQNTPSNLHFASSENII